MAVNEALRFAFASLCLDRAWNLMKFGIAIAARMPMIATTIISSIRVKPFCSLFIGYPLLTDGKSIGMYPTCLDARNDRARLLCFYKSLILKKDHIHQRQIIHTAERFLKARF